MYTAGHLCLRTEIGSANRLKSVLVEAKSSEGVLPGKKTE